MIKDFRFFRNLHGEAEGTRWDPRESPGEGGTKQCYLLRVPMIISIFREEGLGKAKPFCRVCRSGIDVWSWLSLNLEADHLTALPLPIPVRFSGAPWF